MGWLFIAILEWREILKNKREGEGNNEVVEKEGDVESDERDDPMMFEMLEM